MKNVKKIIALLIIIVLVILAVVVIMKKSQVNIETPAKEENATATVGEYQNFECTGGVQTYTAPVMGVYKLEVWGAQGGSIGIYSGGKGGYSTGNITLNKGDILYVVPGNNNGYNGGGVISKPIQGGESTGQSGGGATHIATTNRGELKNYENNKNEILIVAGGGGGALYGFEGDMASGGSGGGLTGGQGEDGDYGGGNYLGTGGTQDKPGDSIGSPYEDNQKAGFGYGAGGSDLYAGGGGGWYGGGNTYYYGGGAGGSGYIGGVTSGTTQNGVNEGNGHAKITLIQISDITPPTCTITPQVGNPTNASTIQYNIDFSEEVYNFERTDISVQNGTITNFWGSGANYAITVTNGGSCTQTITVGANVCNDFAGNGNIGASASRLIDRTLPTIAVNPTNGGYAKSRNVTITVGDVGGSGLSNSNKYQYYLSNSSTALVDGTWTNYTSGTAFTIGAGKTGAYYIFVRRIADNVGNISTTGGNSIAIGGETYQRFGPYSFDNTVPTAGTMNMKIGNSTGATYTNNTWTNQSVYIAPVNGTDGHSGHQRTTYSVSGTKTLNNQTTAITLTETGTYNITVTTTDNVGLTATRSGYIIKIDKTKPTAGTMNMKIGNSTGATYTNNTWTNQSVYIEPVNGSDAHSGHQRTTYSVSGTKTLNNQTAGTMLTETGTYNITVTTTDNVGLTATSGTYTVKIDKAIPTVTVTPTSGGYVKNRDATIIVEETGGSGLSGSNSYQYYLSKSNTTLTDGTWTNYTSGTEFRIGEGKTGKYYLFVKKIRDNAGNTNTVEGIPEKTIEGVPCQIYGTYYFDNTPPVIEKAELINNVLKIEANDVNEENSGLSKYRYITSTMKLANPNLTAQNSTERPATGEITIPNINEVRYIYILVEDMVGNVSRIVEVKVPQITLEGEVNLEAEERKGGVDLSWNIEGKGDKTYKIYQKDRTENQWREINVTNELAMTTNTSKDTVAPNSPTIKVNEIDENDKINISYTTTDNGSTYKFYAKACDRVNNNITLSTSGEITKEIKTGLKGYYYIIDESLDNEFNMENAIYTEEEYLKLDLKHNGKYIRMKAVDVAGNIGEESNSIIYKISSLKENLDGGTLNGKTGTVTVTELAGKRIDIGEAEKEGYTFDAWEVKKGLEVGKNGSLLGTKFTFGRESGEVTARYEINNYGYKIEYYYAGIKDESKTKVGVAQYSSIIEEYKEELREGYVLARTENYPLTIGVEENKIESETITEEEANNIKNNIIKIYYEKRKDLSYTINYLEEETNKVIFPSKEVQNQTFEDIITANDEVIEIPGYYYERSDKENITIAVDKEQNVINLYYTKRNDLTYTVKYLEKGTEKEIKEQKVVANQLFESVVSTADEIITIDGYNYNYIENNPITITAYDENNIVKIYYTKRHDLSYTIKYLEKGTKKELHEQKRIEDQIFEDIVISEQQVIPITGYNYDSSNKDKLIISTNEDENIIELYYTKRNDLKYTVKYLEEETHEELHEPRIIENQTFEAIIIAKEQVIEIEGYEYSSSDKEKIIIGINEEENVITIYYIKRSDLTYTVNYIDKETGEKIIESKKEVNQVYGGKILASNEIIQIDGYNYTNCDKEEITIGVDESENIINIYYTILKDIKYKIEYYYDGEKDDNATEEKEGTYKEKIEKYEEKLLEGYTLIEVTGIPLIIGTKEEMNVIRVYYGTKAQVTIRYIDKNTEEVLEEIIEEGYIGKEIEPEAKDFESYVLVEEPQEKTVTMTKEEIIIEYKYAHISSGVIEKHIDFDTGVILYNEVHEGNEGDSYKIEPKEFERYYLVEEEYPENSEGEMEKEAITVIYYYKKEQKIKITVKYLDKETKDRIEEEQIIEDYKGEEYKTEKKEIQGYQFVEIVGQAEGTITQEQEIIYYYQKIKIPDNMPDDNSGETTDSTTIGGGIPNAGMMKQVITGTAFFVIILTMATLIVFAVKGTIIYRKYKR